jgi:RNA recognition motif-containing protein
MQTEKNSQLYLASIPGHKTLEEVLSEVRANVRSFLDLRMPTGNRGIAYLALSSKDEADALVKNKLRLFGRLVEVRHRKEGAELEAEKIILGQKRVFLSNLPPGISDQEIHREFDRQIGPVESAYRCRVQDKSLEKNYGNLTFTDPEHAKKALQMKTLLVKGRKVKISQFKPQQKEKTSPLVPMPDPLQFDNMMNLYLQYQFSPQFGPGIFNQPFPIIEDTQAAESLDNFSKLSDKTQKESSKPQCQYWLASSRNNSFNHQVDNLEFKLMLPRLHKSRGSPPMLVPA